MTLIESIGLRSKDNVCIIGCGGKTSLMFSIAEAYRQSRVLLSTTTHIAFPDAGFYDRFIGDDSALPATLQPGITVLGKPEPSGVKMKSISAECLRNFTALADLTLVEGDGSRSLPLKGWEDYEPVIPDWATVTIGVVTVWTVGLPVSDEIVFRLPRFQALTGARESEPVTVRHIADMVASENGMFHKAVGRRILVINQVESEASAENAMQLAEALRIAPLDAIVAGSVRQHTGSILWTRH